MTSKLTAQGRVFLQIPMIIHLSKMVSTHLWSGNKESLLMYTRLLKSIVSQQPKAMEVIPPRDLERFLYVTDCFTNEINPVPWKSDSIRNLSSSLTISHPFSNEAELQRVMVYHPEILQETCYVESCNGLRIEAKAGEGKADIVFDSGREVHVLELKVDQADHRVVGQIQKYMRDVGSRIHYNLYDDVVGWVIAPGFNDETARELADIGVRMVKLNTSYIETTTAKE